MLEVKNNLKWYKKIPFVCVIVSILVCLGGFVCSADVTQIGQGYTDVDGVRIYTNPPSDHGIPFETIYNTFAFSNFVNNYGFGNSFIVSDVGVTYPPTTGTYISDTYPRMSIISNYNSQSDLYPSAVMPFMYSNYSFLSAAVSASSWYDDVVSYEYFTYPNGTELSQCLNTMGGDPVDSVEYLNVRVNGRDLFDSNSYVASTVTFRSDAHVSVDLIKSSTDDNSYYPNFITNYCLVPIQTIGYSPYAKITFRGYSIGADGVKSERTFVINSETSNILGNYFDYDQYAYVEDIDLDSLRRDNPEFLTYLYDTVYGLDVYYCDFDIDQFVVDYCETNHIDVLTYIDVAFGLEVSSTNSKINDFNSITGSYPICGSSINYRKIVPYTMSVHNTEVYNYIKYHVADIPVASDFSLAWLGQTVSDVLDVNLFGSFGIGDILICVLSIGIVVSFLKIFAGG